MLALYYTRETPQHAPCQAQLQSLSNLLGESTTAGDLPTKEGMSGSTLASRGGLPPVSSAELLSCLSLSGGLLAQAAGLAWTNYSSDEWIYCPGLCGWHDRCPSAATGPPDGIAGCSRGFAPVMCAWCVVEVVYGWGPSAWCALWRLLRWLKSKQTPSVFCDSLRIPLSCLLSSTLLCVLMLCNSLLHQPALFRHRHRP